MHLFRKFTFIVPSKQAKYAQESKANGSLQVFHHHYHIFVSINKSRCLQLEKRDLNKRIFTLQAENELLDKKLKYFTKESSLNMADIEEALVLINEVGCDITNDRSAFS